MNICYIILNVLFLIVAKIRIGKTNLNKKHKLILLGAYLLFTIISCSYISGMINSIFKLKFVDVKSYITLLIISNVIMLYSLNKPIKLVYKIINIILYIILTVIS